MHSTRIDARKQIKHAAHKETDQKKKEYEDPGYEADQSAAVILDN